VDVDYIKKRVQGIKAASFMKGYSKLVDDSGGQGRHMGVWFHSITVFLHFAATVMASVLLFKCNASRAFQRATIPYALPLPVQASARSYERAGYPWAEDGAFVGNAWNPFALILAFEWITVAFAICNLEPYVTEARTYSSLWLTLGLIMVALWTFVNIGDISLFLSVVLVFSFLAAGFLCEYFKDVHGKRVLPKKKQVRPNQVAPSVVVVTTPRPEAPPPAGKWPNEDPPVAPGAATRFLERTSMEGREW
jgi:hypothetical protein